MTTPNGSNPELPQKKKTKRLSQRPLKRWIIATVELGAYHNGTSQKFILWGGHLPRGKHARFKACIQAVHRPGNLGDKIHNPVLFQRVVQLPNNPDCELVSKHAMFLAKKAFCQLCKEVLEKATRPVLSFTCGDAQATYEPGHSTHVLGEWRQGVVNKISAYLGSWEEQL